MCQDIISPDPNLQDDDTFHDAALSDLLRAATDLTPWYTARQMGNMIEQHFARLRAEHEPVAIQGDPFKMEVA